MQMSLKLIYQYEQDKGGLSFHAGLLQHNGKGILLAASGSIGKSTCCCRIPSPWKALCDDEALVVQDDQIQYFVHPFPTWSNFTINKGPETSWDVQQFLPLSALFFLEQAQTNEVIPIGQGEAAVRINKSAIEVCNRTLRFLDKEKEKAIRKKVFSNACQIAKVIPAFILRVSLSGPFWVEMEKVL